MTDQRISTEEAERMAFAIQGRAMEITGTGELVYDEELRDAADAVRSLAAERDELKNQRAALVRWYALSSGISEERIFESLGENQP